MYGVYSGFIDAAASTSSPQWPGVAQGPTLGRWAPLGLVARCYNSPMSESARTVFCVKLQKQLPGLDAPPWPGELGQRLYANVSAEAWKVWEDRMKMILNEYRLLPWQKEAQDLVARQMEDFFFGEGSALPPEFKPQ